MTNETIDTAALAEEIATEIEVDLLGRPGKGVMLCLSGAQARALAALLRGVVWQPIETAQKDEEFLAPSADGKAVWTVRVFEHPRKGRLVINGRTGLVWRAAHWMPLPSFPSPPLSTTKEG